jgi:hypothetical protein
MTITKCDMCGKKIDRENKLFITYKFSFPSTEICLTCGKPVETFLKKHKLVKIEK